MTGVISRGFVWNLPDLTLYSWIIINPIIRTINLVATSWLPDSHATARRLSRDCRATVTIPIMFLVSMQADQPRMKFAEHTRQTGMLLFAHLPALPPPSSSVQLPALPPPSSSMQLPRPPSSKLLRAAHCSLCVKCMLYNLGIGRIYRKSNIDTSEVTWRHIDRVKSRGNMLTIEVTWQHVDRMRSRGNSCPYVFAQRR